MLLALHRQQADKAHAQHRLRIWAAHQHYPPRLVCNGLLRITTAQEWRWFIDYGSLRSLQQAIADVGA